MGGGGTGADGIIPLALGVVVFVVMIATLISMPSFQRTMDTSENYANPNIPSGSSLFSSNVTVVWDLYPGAVDPINSSVVSDNYYQPPYVDRSPNNLAIGFVDPNHDNHFIDVRVIVNNTDYDPYYIGDDNTIKYDDYLMLDGYISNLGGLWTDKAWQIAIPYFEIILSKTDSDYSVIILPEYNLSLVISTFDPFNPFLNVTVEDGLNNNSYDISFVQTLPPSGGPDIWTIAWWLLTLDTRWLPGIPFIAAAVSLMVDVVILLIVVRIVQGFIP